MTVGERIRQTREAEGIGQTELADKIGIGKQLLYKYERGITTNIPIGNIEAIARVLGVTPAYLMGWEEAHEMQLTDTERRLIVAYRASSDEIQEAVCSILKVRRPASSASAGRSA